MDEFTPVPGSMDEFMPKLVGRLGFELARPGFEPAGLGFELSRLGFELPGPGFELCRLGFKLAGLGFELERPWSLRIGLGFEGFGPWKPRSGLGFEVLGLGSPALVWGWRFGAPEAQNWSRDRFSSIFLMKVCIKRLHFQKRDQKVSFWNFWRFFSFFVFFRGRSQKTCVKTRFRTSKSTKKISIKHQKT